MKVLIYGTEQKAEELLRFIGKCEEFEIISFVETKRSKRAFHGKTVIELCEIKSVHHFDYLIVASGYYEEIRQALLSSYGEGILDRTYFYLDFIEMIKEHYPFVPYYSTYTREGLMFIYDSRDLIIGPCMKQGGSCFSKNDIERFIRLSNQYYGISPDNKAFIDVGANIGTTSIYVKKKWPSMKVIAIEPGIDNYRVLKANCILNAVDVDCLNYGVSDSSYESDYHYIPENPGASAVTAEKGKKLVYATTGVQDSNDENNTERIRMRSLVELINECGIDEKSIGYLWIDTQGFETKIMNGAASILKNNRISVLQEFSPNVYKTNGEWSSYVSTIQGLYDHFIDFDDAENETLISVDELERFAAEMNRDRREFTNLFFIRENRD